MRLTNIICGWRYKKRSSMSTCYGMRDYTDSFIQFPINVEKFREKAVSTSSAFCY
jgi:hypothetical protein